MPNPWEMNWEKEKPKSSRQPWEMDWSVKASGNKQEDSSLIKTAKDVAGIVNPILSTPDSRKKALGFAVGVGEAANSAFGLGVPHAVESLGRAVFTESGGPLERLQKGSENASIPQNRISDVAPMVRSLARKGAQEVKDVFGGPDAQPINEIYDEEVASQKSFNKDFTGQTSQDIGELTANSALMVKGLIDIAKAVPGGVKAVKQFSKQKAFDSLKPLGKRADKIIDSGRATEIGDQLLRDKIVTAGASYKTILKRVNSKLNEYGEKIGHFAKIADDAVSRDGSLRGVPVDDVANEIRKQIVGPLSKDPSTLNVAKDVDGWVTNLEALQNGDDLSFQQIQAIKKNLDGMKAKFKSSSDSLAHGAFQKVYGILSGKQEAGIESALKVYDPKLVNEFVPSKKAFHNLKDAQFLIANTVSRQSKNRGLSLTDNIWGASTAAAGMAALGGPAGLATGIPFAIGNNLLRTKGNQTAAGLLNSLARVVEESSKTGPATKVIEGIGTSNLLQKVAKDKLEKKKK